jgi:hypothetical protein
MLALAQKPFSEILGFLENHNSIFILACEGCLNSAGEALSSKIQATRENLESAGRNVSGTALAEALCDRPLLMSWLQKANNEMAKSDALLVISCGVGVQAVAASIVKLCYPACNTLSVGKRPGAERCAECGDCMLAHTGGVCPMTACAKSLLNGQCGGSKNGRCEVQPAIRECAWILIYDRLKQFGQLDLLKKPLAPKRHSASIPCREPSEPELRAPVEKTTGAAP